MARAALGTIDPSITSGTALAALLSARDAAENTQHLGTGRPTYAAEGLLYTEGSTSPARIFLAGSAGDGSLDIDLSQLFSPRPGTIRPTAEVRLPTGWLWADGSSVVRATYPLLLAAIAPSFTGTTASGSATISAVSEDLRNLGLIGAKIEGTGVPANATITAITATTITLSANATSSNTSTALRAFPYGSGNGSTTFTLPNLKDRVIIGRGDMGGSDASLITTAGAGFDGTRLGASGGVQTFALATADLPVHSHSASSSGTTSAAGAHTHTVGSVGDHGHVVNIGATTTSAGDHAHTLDVVGTSPTGGAASGALNASNPTSGTANYVNNAGAHTHGVTIVGFTGNTGAHTHSLTSVGDHTHTLTISTTIGNTGSGTAHQNVQPSIVCNVVIKT